MAGAGRKQQGYAGVERRKAREKTRVCPVRLTRKFAEAIDDIDLRGREVGDRLPLRSRDARLLIAEGWAEPVPPSERRRCNGFRK